MFYNLAQDPISHLILFQSVILLVVLSNIYLLHRARQHTPPQQFPMVSILVPARNEEENIHRCIQSLLAQDYPSFEVLVLDDQSTDGTLSILQEIACAHPRLSILTGSPAPEGQMGKNWACTQLAQQAQGDLLFFTDADTNHQPQTLRQTVTTLLGEQADLLTGYPRQLVQSWGERLLVPFFSWAFLCFTPLWLAYRLRTPSLSSAVGQMMLFRREAYRAIGGHAGLGMTFVEDLALAKKIKASGLRWRVAGVTDLISCRMYHQSQEAYHGFTKNLFAAFDFSLLKYLFIFIFLAYLFWRPLLTLAALALGWVQAARITDLLVCIGLSLLLWLIPYLYLRGPWGLALLYPLIILAVEVVAFQSLRLSLTGRLTWKGRPLARPKWKWL
jgi:chlorobactene glucosyltransferase